MKTRHLFLVFAVCLISSLVQAQQTLSDLVQEANANWIIGSWKASTDTGGTFRLDITWDLDKHAVVLHGKGDDIEFKGFSVLEPGSDQVSYFGFDNHGVVSKGMWSKENDELVLRVESRTDEGARKMAAVFTSTVGGLDLRLHRLDDSGNLVAPEHVLMQFKKS